MTDESTPRAPDAWLVTWPLLGGGIDLLATRRVNPDWAASKVHHAEPLYTLPNALRALAEDDDLVVAMAGSTALSTGWTSNYLCALADDLDNPVPPIPPEPTGDVVVFDMVESPWRKHGDWWATANRGGGWDWVTLVQEFGPVKVYEARS